MSFFISDALAAATTTPGHPDGTMTLILTGAMFILFYFMLIRPQTKRAKEHRDLISDLKKGDEVVTSGGLIGKIVSMQEQFIKIAIAEGTEVNLQRSAVTTVLPKGTLKSL